MQDIKRHRIVYCSDNETWAKVIKIQKKLNMRTRQSVIDLVINEFFEGLDDENK